MISKVTVHIGLQSLHHINCYMKPSVSTIAYMYSNKQHIYCTLYSRPLYLIPYWRIQTWLMMRLKRAYFILYYPIALAIQEESIGNVFFSSGSHFTYKPLFMLKRSKKKLSNSLKSPRLSSNCYHTLFIVLLVETFTEQLTSERLPNVESRPEDASLSFYDITVNDCNLDFMVASLHSDKSATNGQEGKITRNLSSECILRLKSYCLILFY